MLRQAKRSDDTILPAALKFLASPPDRGSQLQDLTPAPQSTKHEAKILWMFCTSGVLEERAINLLDGRTAIERGILQAPGARVQAVTISGQGVDVPGIR
jgi:hypothetical protein